MHSATRIMGHIAPPSGGRPGDRLTASQRNAAILGASFRPRPKLPAALDNQCRRVRNCARRGFGKLLLSCSDGSAQTNGSFCQAFCGQHPGRQAGTRRASWRATSSNAQHTRMAIAGPSSSGSMALISQGRQPQSVRADERQGRAGDAAEQRVRGGNRQPGNAWPTTPNHRHRPERRRDRWRRHQTRGKQPATKGVDQRHAPDDRRQSARDGPQATPQHRATGDAFAAADQRGHAFGDIVGAVAPGKP